MTVAVIVVFTDLRVDPLVKARARKAARRDIRQRSFGPRPYVLDMQQADLDFWAERGELESEGDRYGEAPRRVTVTDTADWHQVERYGLLSDLELELGDPDEERWFEECGAGWDEADGPPRPTHGRGGFLDDQEADVELERVLLVAAGEAIATERVRRWNVANNVVSPEARRRMAAAGKRNGAANRGGTRARRTHAPLPNQYAKPCVDCGLTVQPGEGLRDDRRDGLGWRIRHTSKAACALAWQRSAEPVAVTR